MGNFSLADQEQYLKAFSLYQIHDFSAAERIWRALADQDEISALMAERCGQFILDKPDDWQGNFCFDHK
jgi:hypothetical protein